MSGRTKLVVEEKVWRAADRRKQARRSSTAEKVREYSPTCILKMGGKGKGTL